MNRIDAIQRYKEFFDKVFKRLCPNCNGIMVITGTEKEEFKHGYRYVRLCSKCGLRKLVSYNELLDVSKEFGLEDLVESSMLEG